jgi:hypothetical protein
MTAPAKTLRLASSPRAHVAIALFAGLALGAAALAQVQPGSLPPAGSHPGDDDGPGMPFFDARLGPDEWPLRTVAAKVEARNAKDAARAAEIARMRSAIADLAIDDSPILGTPIFVRSTSTFLTKGAGKGNSLAESMAVVRSYLADHAALFEIDPKEIDTARIERNYTTDHNGLRHLTFKQTLGGVDLFDCEIRANVAPDGSLINIGSTMLPRPAGDFSVPARVFDDASAIIIAAANVGTKIELNDAPRPAGEPQGPSLRRSWLPHHALRPSETVTTELVYFPLDRDTIHPAWSVLVPTIGVGHTYEILVDAVDGSILRRHDRLVWDTTQPATFNIYPSDGVAPGSPGWANPISTQFPVVPADWSGPSPNGWISDGGMETLGNNVDAHTDLNDDDTVSGADLPRPNGGASRVFDFPLDPTQDPSTYRDASVTELFFRANWYHDRLMALGFDEAAGNFQTTNFTDQGVDNDAVQADCQDSATNSATSSNRNNANFSTGGNDGSSARVQMYIFTGPTPDRDGSLDGDIVYHELTHGTSIRLHHGLSGTQPGGMGEGWSDYFGVSLLAEPTDDPDGNYCTGGYTTYQLWGSGYTTNYYYGIRRYPYSTNLLRNPLTYRFIDPNQLAYPSTALVPRNTNITSSASEVHNIGEVWCNVLLEGRAALWSVYGFAGNQRMMQLVIDGMKVSPQNPNMVQARDAILQADQADYGGADFLTLWNVFSKRGLGPGAASPGGTSAAGVVESYDSIVNATFAYPDGRPTHLAPGVPTTFRVDITGTYLSLLPGTASLHVSVGGGPYAVIPLVPVAGGSDGEYNASIPGQLCGASVSYYFSTDTSQGVKTDPATAPAPVYSAVIVSDTQPGVVSDGFETDTGWTVGPNTATTGLWQRATPQATAAQPGSAHAGTLCWVTDPNAGSGVGSFDVDGGYTTLVSPAYDLHAYSDATVSYYRWYSNGAGSNAYTNSFRVSVSVDNGTTWTPAETVGPGSSSDPNTNPGWILASWSFASLGLTPTSTVRVRFVADDATGAIVEAAIDDFAIDGASCTGAVCRPDYNTDGVVTVQDIFDFLNGWFVSAPSADYNTDGVVTVQDIFDFLNGWFAGC